MTPVLLPRWVTQLLLLFLYCSVRLRAYQFLCQIRHDTFSKCYKLLLRLHCRSRYLQCRCHAFFDSFSQPFYICHKEIIPHQLYISSQSNCQQFPSFPIFLIQRIFYRANWKFLHQFFVIIYQLFRRTDDLLPTHFTFTWKFICLKIRII